MYCAYLVKYDEDGNSQTTCFYDSYSALVEDKLISPKLTLEENKAGSFEFTIAPGGLCYDEFTKLTSYVIVTKLGREIWEGRVIDEQMDFFKRKTITCEGEFAYFNDICHPYFIYKFQSGMQYLSGLLYVYNDKVPDHMKFELGMVTVDLDNFPEQVQVNYESIMELLKELHDTYGGIFRVRKETNVDGTNVRYLDWLEDYPRVSTQPIEFGNNLLDYTHSFDITDLCTVVIPLGETIGSDETGNPDERLTCADANDGSPYVVSEEAVEKFGWIEKVLDCNDVTSEGTLLSEGLRYLAEEQFDKMTIEITAFDLSYMNERSYWFETVRDKIESDKVHLGNDK